jgi:hypothetical protein
MFRDRKISKDIWPTQLPNLISPDYYLWGAKKGTFYEDNPHTLLDVKEAIKNFIRNITPIEFLLLSLQTRYVDACLQAHGSHFQHSVVT